MGCILRNTQIGPILYSVDCPFAMNEKGLSYIEELWKIGLVRKAYLERIAYKNAGKLLRIKVPDGRGL